MTTIPDHVLSKAVGLLNSNCCGPAFNAYDDKDSPSVITVSKLLMDPPATDVAALVEAAKAFQHYGCPVCSGDCGSANPPVMACPMQDLRQALAPFTKGKNDE